jgi:hypothetical protein
VPKTSLQLVAMCCLEVAGAQPEALHAYPLPNYNSRKNRESVDPMNAKTFKSFFEKKSPGSLFSFAVRFLNPPPSPLPPCFVLQ